MKYRNSAPMLNLFALTIGVLAGSPSRAQVVATLWYNGNLFSQSSLRNQVNSAGAGARIYDDFLVPAGQEWHISSIWSNDWLAAFGTPSVTQADWSIRTSISEGDDGDVVAGGVSPATRIATGRIPNFLYREYSIRVHGLSLVLPSGTYWLQVTPVVGEAFNSITKGAGAIGKPAGTMATRSSTGPVPE